MGIFVLDNSNVSVDRHGVQTPTYAWSFGKRADQWNEIRLGGEKADVLGSYWTKLLLVVVVVVNVYSLYISERPIGGEGENESESTDNIVFDFVDCRRQ